MHTIETARVYLRPFTIDDLDAFAVIGSDPDVMRYIGAGRPLSREETQARLNAIIEHRNRHGFGVWAAVDRSNGTLMGYLKDARFYNSDVKYYAITREEYERDGSTWIRRSEEN